MSAPVVTRAQRRARVHGDGAPVPGLARPGRGEITTVALLTIAFALLLGVWAILTPVFDAPDESIHVNSALRTALGDEWVPAGQGLLYESVDVMRRTVDSVPAADRPTVGELLEEDPGLSEGRDQMTQHPPTWYLIGGTVLRLVDFEELRWDRATILLRLLDVATIAPLPLLAWATVRRVTRSPRTALVGALSVFFVPQLASIGASFTNDAPVILCGAVIVWLGSRYLTGDVRWRVVVGLALATGAAALSKGTALPLIPFVAVVLLLGGAATLPLWGRLVRLVAVGGATLALSGWWWIGNVLRYGTLQPNGMVGQRPVVPWPEGETVNLGLFANSLWNGLASSFWGNFGSLAIPMSPIVTDTLTVATIVPLLAFAYRRRDRLGLSVAMSLPPLALVGSLALTSFNSYQDTQGIYAIQGRYLFPGLVAAILLVAIAWRRFLPLAPMREGFGRVLVVGAPLVAAYALTVAYRGFYENQQLEITRDGLALAALLLPVPAWFLVGLVLATAAVGIVAVVRCWRAVSGVPLAGAPADADAPGPTEVASEPVP